MTTTNTIRFVEIRQGRKQLASMLGEHLGQVPAYLGASTFAYQIGEALLDRDWVLTLPASADISALREAVTAKGYQIVQGEEVTPHDATQCLQHSSNAFSQDGNYGFVSSAVLN